MKLFEIKNKTCIWVATCYTAFKQVGL